MLKVLAKEGIVNTMYMFTAILRLQYWPTSIKIAQIIMIHKPGKNPMDVSSCRTMSLLPTISKVLEKLIPKKFNKDLNRKTGPQTINMDSDSLTPQCNNATAY